MRRYLLLAAGLSLSLGFAVRVQAQEVVRLPSRAALSVAVRGATMSDSLVVSQSQSGDTKSIPVAVALSIVPGAGSFYAGHSRHGWTHLGVALASGTLAAGSIIGCALGGFDGSGDDSCLLMDIANAIFIVNYLWSPVTAANDARAHNARR